MRSSLILGILFFSFLCPSVLSADDVRLELVRCGDRPNERAPSFRIRTTTIEPESLKNIPEFRYSSFITLMFGDKSYYGVFMLDGSGRYRRLVFDRDGDGDLQGEEEIRGIREKGGDTSVKRFKIDGVHLSFGGVETKDAGLFIITSGNSIYCVVKVNWCWRGRLKLGDEEFVLTVFDGDGDGEVSDEKFVWVDFNGDGRLGAADMVVLEKPLLYGPRRLHFRIVDEQTIRYEEEKLEDFKTLESPYEGMLAYEDGDGIGYSRTDGGKFYLPEKTERIGYVGLSKTDTDGAVWDMMFELNRNLAGKDELPTPEPLVYTLSVRRSGGASFSFSLKTSRSVSRVTLYRNGSRLGNPLVAIRNEKGKVLHRFKFHPG